MGISVSKKKRGKYSPSAEDPSMTSSDMLRSYEVTAEGAAYRSSLSTRSGGAEGFDSKADKKKAKKDKKKEKKDKTKDKKDKNMRETAGSSIDVSYTGSGHVDRTEAEALNRSNPGGARGPESSQSTYNLTTTQSEYPSHEIPQRHTQSSIDVRLDDSEARALQYSQQNKPEDMTSTSWTEAAKITQASGDKTHQPSHATPQQIQAQNSIRQKISSHGFDKYKVDDDEIRALALSAIHTSQDMSLTSQQHEMSSSTEDIQRTSHDTNVHISYGNDIRDANRASIDYEGQDAPNNALEGHANSHPSNATSQQTQAQTEPSSHGYNIYHVDGEELKALALTTIRSRDNPSPPPPYEVHSSNMYEMRSPYDRTTMENAYENMENNNTLGVKTTRVDPRQELQSTTQPSINDQNSPQQQQGAGLNINPWLDNAEYISLAKTPYPPVLSRVYAVSSTDDRENNQLQTTDYQSNESKSTNVDGNTNEGIDRARLNTAKQLHRNLDDAEFISLLKTPYPPKLERIAAVSTSSVQDGSRLIASRSEERLTLDVLHNQPDLVPSVAYQYNKYDKLQAPQTSSNKNVPMRSKDVEKHQKQISVTEIDSNKQTTEGQPPPVKQRLYKKRESIDKPPNPTQRTSKTFEEEKHTSLIITESPQNTTPTAKQTTIKFPSRDWQNGDPRREDDDVVYYYNEMAVDVPRVRKVSQETSKQRSPSYYGNEIHEQYEEMAVDVPKRISITKQKNPDENDANSTQVFDVTKLKQIESKSTPIVVKPKSRESSQKRKTSKDQSATDYKPVDQKSKSTIVRGNNVQGSDSDGSAVEVVVVKRRTPSDRERQKKHPISRQNATQIVIDPHPTRQEGDVEIPVNINKADKTRSVDMSKAFQSSISREDLKGRRAVSLPEDSEKYLDISWTMEELQEWERVENAKGEFTEPIQSPRNEHVMNIRRTQRKGVDYSQLELEEVVETAIQDSDVGIDIDTPEMERRHFTDAASVTISHTVERRPRVPSPEMGLPVSQRNIRGYYDNTADNYLQRQFPQETVILAATADAGTFSDRNKEHAKSKPSDDQAHRNSRNYELQRSEEMLFYKPKEGISKLKRRSDTSPSSYLSYGKPIKLSVSPEELIALKIISSNNKNRKPTLETSTDGFDKADRKPSYSQGTIDVAVSKEKRKSIEDRSRPLSENVTELNSLQRTRELTNYEVEGVKMREHPTKASKPVHDDSRRSSRSSMSDYTLAVRRNSLTNSNVYFTVALGSRVSNDFSVSSEQRLSQRYDASPEELAALKLTKQILQEVPKAKQPVKKPPIFENVSHGTSNDYPTRYKTTHNTILHTDEPHTQVVNNTAEVSSDETEEEVIHLKPISERIFEYEQQARMSQFGPDYVPPTQRTSVKKPTINAVPVPKRELDKSFETTPHKIEASKRTSHPVQKPVSVSKKEPEIIVRRIPSSKRRTGIDATTVDPLELIALGFTPRNRIKPKSKQDSKPINTNDGNVEISMTRPNFIQQRSHSKDEYKVELRRNSSQEQTKSNRDSLVSSTFIQLKPAEQKPKVTKQTVVQSTKQPWTTTKTPMTREHSNYGTEYYVPKLINRRKRKYETDSEELEALKRTPISGLDESEIALVDISVNTNVKQVSQSKPQSTYENTNMILQSGKTGQNKPIQAGTLHQISRPVSTVVQKQSSQPEKQQIRSILKKRKPRIYIDPDELASLALTPKNISQQNSETRTLPNERKYSRTSSMKSTIPDKAPEVVYSYSLDTTQSRGPVPQQQQGKPQTSTRRKPPQRIPFNVVDPTELVALALTPQADEDHIQIYTVPHNTEIAKSEPENEVIKIQAIPNETHAYENEVASTHDLSFLMLDPISDANLAKRVSVTSMHIDSRPDLEKKRKSIQESKVQQSSVPPTSSSIKSIKTTTVNQPKPTKRKTIKPKEIKIDPTELASLALTPRVLMRRDQQTYQFHPSQSQKQRDSISSNKQTQQVKPKGISSISYDTKVTQKPKSETVVPVYQPNSAPVFGKVLLTGVDPIELCALALTPQTTQKQDTPNYSEQAFTYDINRSHVIFAREKQPKEKRSSDANYKMAPGYEFDRSTSYSSPQRQELVRNASHERPKVDTKQSVPAYHPNSAPMVGKIMLTSADPTELVALALTPRSSASKHISKTHKTTSINAAPKSDTKRDVPEYHPNSAPFLGKIMLTGVDPIELAALALTPVKSNVDHLPVETKRQTSDYSGTIPEYEFGTSASYSFMQPDVTRNNSKDVETAQRLSFDVESKPKKRQSLPRDLPIDIAEIRALELTPEKIPKSVIETCIEQPVAKPRQSKVTRQITYEVNEPVSINVDRNTQNMKILNFDPTELAALRVSQKHKPNPPFKRDASLHIEQIPPPIPDQSPELAALRASLINEQRNRQVYGDDIIPAPSVPQRPKRQSDSKVPHDSELEALRKSQGMHYRYSQGEGPDVNRRITVSVDQRENIKQSKDLTQREINDIHAVILGNRQVQRDLAINPEELKALQYTIPVHLSQVSSIPSVQQRQISHQISHGAEPNNTAFDGETLVPPPLPPRKSKSKTTSIEQHSFDVTGVDVNELQSLHRNRIEPNQQEINQVEMRETNTNVAPPPPLYADELNAIRRTKPQISGDASFDTSSNRQSISSVRSNEVASDYTYRLVKRESGRPSSVIDYDTEQNTLNETVVPNQTQQEYSSIQRTNVPISNEEKYETGIIPMRESPNVLDHTEIRALQVMIEHNRHVKPGSISKENSANKGQIGNLGDSIHPVYGYETLPVFNEEIIALRVAANYQLEIGEHQREQKLKEKTKPSKTTTKETPLPKNDPPYSKVQKKLPAYFTELKALRAMILYHNRQLGIDTDEDEPMAVSYPGNGLATSQKYQQSEQQLHERAIDVPAHLLEQRESRAIHHEHGEPVSRHDQSHERQNKPSGGTEGAYESMEFPESHNKRQHQYEQQNQPKPQESYDPELSALRASQGYSETDDNATDYFESQVSLASAGASPKKSKKKSKDEKEPKKKRSFFGFFKRNKEPKDPEEALKKAEKKAKEKEEKERKKREKKEMKEAKKKSKNKSKSGSASAPQSSRTSVAMSTESMYETGDDLDTDDDEEYPDYQNTKEWHQSDDGNLSGTNTNNNRRIATSQESLGSVSSLKHEGGRKISIKMKAKEFFSKSPQDDVEGSDNEQMALPYIGDGLRRDAINNQDGQNSDANILTRNDLTDQEMISHIIEQPVVPALDVLRPTSGHQVRSSLVTNSMYDDNTSSDSCIEDLSADEGEYHVNSHVTQSANQVVPTTQIQYQSRQTKQSAENNSETEHSSRLETMSQVNQLFDEIEQDQERSLMSDIDDYFDIDDDELMAIMVLAEYQECVVQESIDRNSNMQRKSKSEQEHRNDDVEPFHVEESSSDEQSFPCRMQNVVIPIQIMKIDDSEIKSLEVSANHQATNKTQNVATSVARTTSNEVPHQHVYYQIKERECQDQTSNVLRGHRQGLVINAEELIALALTRSPTGKVSHKREGDYSMENLSSEEIWELSIDNTELRALDLTHTSGKRPTHQLKSNISISHSVEEIQNTSASQKIISIEETSLDIETDITELAALRQTSVLAKPTKLDVSKSHTDGKQIPPLMLAFDDTEIAALSKSRQISSTVSPRSTIDHNESEANYEGSTTDEKGGFDIWNGKNNSDNTNNHKAVYSTIQKRLSGHPGMSQKLATDETELNALRKTKPITVVSSHVSLKNTQENIPDIPTSTSKSRKTSPNQSLSSSKPQLIRSLQDIHAEDSTSPGPVNIQSCEELLKFSMIKTGGDISRNSSLKRSKDKKRSVGNMLRKGSSRIRRSLQRLTSSTSSKAAENDDSSSKHHDVTTGYRDPHVNDMHTRLAFVEQVTQNPSFLTTKPPSLEQKSHKLIRSRSHKPLKVNDEELIALKHTGLLDVLPLNSHQKESTFAEQKELTIEEPNVIMEQSNIRAKRLQVDDTELLALSKSSPSLGGISWDEDSSSTDHYVVPRDVIDQPMNEVRYMEKNTSSNTLHVSRDELISLRMTPYHMNEKYISDGYTPPQQQYHHKQRDSTYATDETELQAISYLIENELYIPSDDTYPYTSNSSARYSVERRGGTTKPQEKPHGISSRATIESGDYTRIVEDEELLRHIMKRQRQQDEFASHLEHVPPLPPRGVDSDMEDGEGPYYSTAEERHVLAEIARRKQRTSEAIATEHNTSFEQTKVSTDATQVTAVGPKFFTEKPLNRLPLREKRKYPDIFKLSQEDLLEYEGNSEVSDSDTLDMEGYHPAGLFEHVAKMVRMPDTARGDPLLESTMTPAKPVANVRIRPSLNPLREQMGLPPMSVIQVSPQAVTIEQAVPLQAIAQKVKIHSLVVAEKEMPINGLTAMDTTTTNEVNDRISPNGENNDSSDKENTLTEDQTSVTSKPEVDKKTKHRSRRHKSRKERDGTESSATEKASHSEDEREKRRKERHERKKRERRDKERAREKENISKLSTDDEGKEELKKKKQKKTKKSHHKSGSDSDATLTNDVTIDQSEKEAKVKEEHKRHSSKHRDQKSKEKKSHKDKTHEKDNKEKSERKEKHDKDKKKESKKDDHHSEKKHHHKDKSDTEDENSSNKKDKDSRSKSSKSEEKRRSERSSSKSKTSSSHKRESKDSSNKENREKNDRREKKSENDSRRKSSSKRERSSKETSSLRKRSSSTSSLVNVRSGRNMRALPRAGTASQSRRKQDLQRYLEEQQSEVRRSEDMRVAAQALINDAFMGQDKQVQKLFEEAFPEKEKQGQRRTRHSTVQDNYDDSLPPLSPGSFVESTGTIQTEPIRGVSNKHSKHQERSTSALDMLYSEGSLKGYSPRSAVHSYVPMQQKFREQGHYGRYYGAGAVNNSYEKQMLLDAVRREIVMMKPL